MLQWNDLHPYNAVHVARIPEPLDPERLTKVINARLETLGLAGLALNRDQGTYHYRGGPARCAINSLMSEAGAESCLASQIEHQLNTAFIPSEGFSPFRFFAVPQGDFFFLGLAYFHPVADAESIVLLMKNLADNYLGRAALSLTEPLELYPSGYDNLLRRPLLLARKLAALPAQVKNLRSSCRPAFRDEQNLNNGFSFFSLTPAILLALTKAAKGWEVTLNDLFLALLLKCLSPLATGRAQSPKRRKISVGCIVNLRKDLGLNSPRTFGLFLGSFVITHEVPGGISLMNLARDIRSRTLGIKRHKLYMGAAIEMAFARLMLSFFSTDRRKKLYQKHYPLWGGITNMNLNSLWEQPTGESPIDYFRAVSTGPVTPLVLSLTTVRDCVNIGLTFRSTVFSAPQIEGIKRDFLDAVSHLEGQP